MLPQSSAIAEGHQKGVVLYSSFISSHRPLHPVDYTDQMATELQWIDLMKKKPTFFFS